MDLLVFKFVEVPENNEKPVDQKNNRVKFKIMSLKVKGPMDYVPELVRPSLPFAQPSPTIYFLLDVLFNVNKLINVLVLQTCNIA